MLLASGFATEAATSGFSDDAQCPEYIAGTNGQNFAHRRIGKNLNFNLL